jgi:hypothetical protein
MVTGIYGARDIGGKQKRPIVERAGGREGDP